MRGTLNGASFPLVPEGLGMTCGPVRFVHSSDHKWEVRWELQGVAGAFEVKAAAARTDDGAVASLLHQGPATGTLAVGTDEVTIECGASMEVFTASSPLLVSGQGFASWHSRGPLDHLSLGLAAERGSDRALGLLTNERTTSHPELVELWLSSAYQGGPPGRAEIAWRQGDGQSNASRYRMIHLAAARHVPPAPDDTRWSSHFSGLVAVEGEVGAVAHFDAWTRPGEPPLTHLAGLA
jgi:hypothetical protein